MIEENEIGPRNFGVCPKCDRRVERVEVEVIEAEHALLTAVSFRCPHPDCSVVLGVQWNLNDPTLWKTIAEDLRKTSGWPQPFAGG
jgi:hypothetical protein